MAEFLRTKLKPLDKATQSPTSEFLNIQRKQNTHHKKEKLQRQPNERAFSKATLG